MARKMTRRDLLALAVADAEILSTHVVSLFGDDLTPHAFNLVLHRAESARLAVGDKLAALARRIDKRT